MSARAVLRCAPLLAFAGWTAGCRAPAPAPSESRPLASFAPALRASVETTALDIGEPEAGAQLLEGWGPAERAGATSFQWGAGERSRLRFELVAVRDLELRLRGWSFPFAGGGAQRVALFVNGEPVGEQAIGTTAATLVFALPAPLLAAGENLLELRYARWNERAGEAPWAIAWDGLRLQPSGSGGARTPQASPAPEIDVAGGTIRLPAGTAVEATLALTPGTRLAWQSVAANGDARLEVTVERESAAARSQTVQPGADGAVALNDLQREPALVRFALRAPGTSGAVRVQGLHLERLLPPAGESATAAALAPGRLPPAAGSAGSSPAAVAAAPATAGPRPDLIVYLIDTLRADHLGCYGYRRPTSPRIDRFAAGAVLFRHGRAQSSWTKPAVATVLTGLYPMAHGAELRSQRIHESVETLAERLQAAGYETAFFTTNTNVVARFGFAQGWDSFRYLTHRKGRKHEHLDAAEMNAEIFAWLAERERRSPAKPLFLFVHTLDPHDPYRPREEFRRRLAPAVDLEAACCARSNELAALSGAAAERRAADAMALYDAEIAQNDDAFGEFVDELDRRGLGASAAVLLTADHGEEFFEHGGWKHGFTLYEELLRIPFVLRLPGASGRASAGRVVEAPVEQIDIAPTLLALAGAAPSPELPGRDVRALLADPGFGAGSSGWQPRASFAWLVRPGSVLTSAVADSWKLIRFAGAQRVVPGGGEAAAATPVERPDRELYDLARDPGERTSLLDPSRRRPLRELWLEGEVAAVLARHGGRQAAEEAEIDPELEKSLRALGYF